MIWFLLDLKTDISVEDQSEFYDYLKDFRANCLF